MAAGQVAAATTLRVFASQTGRLAISYEAQKRLLHASRLKTLHQLDGSGSHQIS